MKGKILEKTNEPATLLTLFQKNLEFFRKKRGGKIKNAYKMRLPIRVISCLQISDICQRYLTRQTDTDTILYYVLLLNTFLWFPIFRHFLESYLIWFKYSVQSAISKPTMYSFRHSGFWWILNRKNDFFRSIINKYVDLTRLEILIDH